MTGPGGQTLLGAFNAPDTEVEERMIRELDALLDHPPRNAIPAGTILFRQGDPLDGIFVLIEGTVSLYQVIEGQEVVFHSQTVGKIIGLLALTRHSHSFFHCRAVTPLTVMQVPFDALDRALLASPTLLVAFITVLLRSMARRNKRLVELQREVIALNHSLSSERDALSRTLRELEQAQALLVESEKMATLGQLAAGVAHELNNPIAAIDRAADFVHRDLVGLAGELPDGTALQDMLERTFTRKPASTRTQREARRALATSLGDESLAEQLVGLGIHTPEEYTRLCAGLHGPAETRLARLERFHLLGGALRNIRSCAARITELVKSLRAYSRDEQRDDQTADLHEGLEDTLRLFANRLRDVTVERQYGELPLVPGRAGELNQVWTNLINNALDAMHNQGALTIATAPEPPGHVTVSIIDNGPGIPPENLPRIFDLRFTTRQGRVEFGLGLGLNITRNIVTRHGGRIDITSRPGHTEFRVVLPIVPPPVVPSREETTP
jgi:signal transduction histidine kinase